MIRPLTNYFQESFQELRHVSWPNRKQIIHHSVVIIISVAVAMLIIAAFDYGLSLLVDRFIIQ